MSLSVHDNECPEGEEAAFTRDWGGISSGYWSDQGCWSEEYYVTTMTRYCAEEKLESQEAVTMTKINGKVICGKRAGLSFAEVVRPKMSSGLCPDGT